LITFSSYRANAEKPYAKLKFLNLHDIYKLQIAELMHQIEHGCLLSVFNNLFTRLGIHRQKTSRIYSSQEKIGCWTKISCFAELKFGSLWIQIWKYNLSMLLTRNTKYTS